MTQEELNRQLSEIPDEVLIEKSTAILNDWCAGGNKFTMSVPPTKNCPDLIVAELIERFKVLSNPKYYQIDFDGNVLAQLKIQNGNLEVLRAINGYGYKIEESTITEVDEDARKI